MKTVYLKLIKNKIFSVYTITFLMTLQCRYTFNLYVKFSVTLGTKLSQDKHGKRNPKRNFQPGKIGRLDKKMTMSLKKQNKYVSHDGLIPLKGKL